MEQQVKGKLKKISKGTMLWISALVLLGGSGLGVGIYFIVKNFTKELSYIDTTQQQTYIRERSMSLKFDSIPSSTGVYEEMFGTTWIMGKDSVNTNKYYLATNIHVVAPASIESNNNIINPPSSSSTFKINDNFVNSITLGFPKDPSKIYSDGGDLILEQIAPANFPTIEYLGTSFNDHSYATAPSGFIPYSMTDIAILGFDFSSTTSSFKSYLQYYENNPTKFSTVELNAQTPNTYFVGGYPAVTWNQQWGNRIGIWNFGDSQNQSILNENGLIVSPSFSTSTTPIPNKSYPIGNTGTYYDVFGSSTGTIFPNNIKYAENNSLTFNNYSFQNIANQISIGNLNLEGGSSGSMVINQNYEVCGIYWGVYTATVKNTATGVSENQYLGSFDIFKSAAYNYGNTSAPLGSYPAYNTLQSIKNKIPTISGGNWNSSSI